MKIVIDRNTGEILSVSELPQAQKDPRGQRSFARKNWSGPWSVPSCGWMR